MTTGNQTTIAGNLASDPELRFTPSGTAVATLNVGVSERRQNPANEEWEDAGTSWFRVIVWKQPAEYVAESLTRGMRVMVTGTMRQRNYETKEGEKRVMWELTADEIGVSLKFASVTGVKRANRSRPTSPDTSDPWAGIPATRERPGNGGNGGSESPAESASPAGTAESGASPQSPAEPATATAGGSSGGARKRPRTRSRTPAASPAG